MSNVRKLPGDNSNVNNKDFGKIAESAPGREKPDLSRGIMPILGNSKKKIR